MHEQTKARKRIQPPPALPNGPWERAPSQSSALPSTMDPRVLAAAQRAMAAIDELLSDIELQCELVSISVPGEDYYEPAARLMQKRSGAILPALEEALATGMKLVA